MLDEVFRLIGTIAISNEAANKALDETSDKAEKSHSRIGSAFSKIGSVAVTAAKVGFAAIGAVGAGIIALTKNAIQNFGEYEQLVGGVETLFKDSSVDLMDYAKAAYKTAGMSANDYMTMVTSFSASLLQSLNGDTARAVEMADMAITDMADNANKMGTSMESIQNAYQGFAKQNYTMLDNLKLGYGGTKEEMQRLLDDAEKLSGVHYDISSYADLVDAIHVVQTEIGITGTTAKEASSTIQGSWGMMKSAWTNFMTGMADPEQNFDNLMDDLVTSAMTFADNLVPRIAATVPRLVEGLSGVVQSLSGYLPDIITQLLPAVITGATTLLGELITGLPTIVETVAPVLVESIKTIFTKAFGEESGGAFGSLFDSLITSFSQVSAMVQNMMPGIIDVVLQILPPLMNIAQSILPVFVTLMSMLMPFVMQFIDTVLPMIVEYADLMIPLFLEIVESVLPVIFDLISELLPIFLQVIEEILPVVLELIEQMLPFILQLVNEVLPIIVDLIKQLLPPFLEIIEAVLPVFSELLQLLLPVLLSLFDSMSPILQMIIDFIVPIVDLIAQAITPLMDSIMLLISSAFEVLQPLLDTLIETIGVILAPILESLMPIFETLLGAISPILDIFTVIIGVLLEHFVPIIQVVADVVGGVLGGAFSAIAPILEAVMDILGNLIEFIANVFTGNWEGAWNNIVEIFKGIFNLIPAIVEGVINLAIGVVNGIIRGINDLTEKVGIDAISIIPDVNLPRLEDGALLEKGQTGFLEGNGAEAVVPLDKNKKWISRVTDEFDSQGIGGGSETLSILQEILLVLYDLKDNSDDLPGKLLDILMNSLRIEMDNREFARAVRKVKPS